MIRFVLLLFLCSFLACRDTNENDIKVFKYSEFNNITSLDPAFARSNNNMWSVNQIFDGLLTLGDDLSIQPCIAKRWEITDNGTTYTFILRDDVYFHQDTCFNGSFRKLLASDVVYSFNRIVDDNTASPGSWIFKDKVRKEAPFVAPNDSTFVLYLNQPFIPMLGLLTMQYCNIVPKEALDFYGPRFRSNPVGSGPFKFKRWVENQSLFLNRNPDYMEEGLPLLDGIKVNIVGDRKIAFLELLNGKLDYFSGLESSFVDELLTDKGSLQEDKKESIRFAKAPFLNFEYLGINSQTEHLALKNKYFRQALNYSIDRSTMLRILRNNVGIPANSGVVPRGLPSFSPQKVPGYTYDLDKARELIQLADIGSPIPPLVLKTNNDYLDLCTFIANQWKKIGVQTKIEVVESAILRDEMRNGKVDLFRGSWIADYPDAENFLCLFYSLNPAPPNYTQFAHPQFDEMYEAAVSEVNDSLRFALYHKMASLVIEEAPVIFLFYDEKAQFTSKRVMNMSSNAVNMLDLKAVDLLLPN